MNVFRVILAVCVLAVAFFSCKGINSWSDGLEQQNRDTQVIMTEAEAIGDISKAAASEAEAIKAQAETIGKQSDHIIIQSDHIITLSEEQIQEANRRTAQAEAKATFLSWAMIIGMIVFIIGCIVLIAKIFSKG